MTPESGLLGSGLQSAPDTNESDHERRAAIYARTSSVNQQTGYSLGEQVRQCWERCERLDWSVVRVYRDQAKSGKNMDRQQFQRLMTDADLGRFDVVVFWKLDRFSRSIMHIVQLEAEFRELDIGLHSVTEQIDTTTVAGRFNFRNIANAAEFERELIKQRTKMGTRAMALEGKWPNPRPPLGYTKTDDNRLAIHDPEADLVARIFDLYIDKRSMPQVADQLNAEGVTTKRGTEWTPSAIGSVLGNELYHGHYEVAGVSKTIPEYEIISKQIFETVETIRHRFQSSESTDLPSMEKQRKQRLCESVLEEYSEYLTS